MLRHTKDACDLPSRIPVPPPCPLPSPPLLDRQPDSNRSTATSCPPSLLLLAGRQGSALGQLHLDGLRTATPEQQQPSMASSSSYNVFYDLSVRPAPCCT